MKGHIYSASYQPLTEEEKAAKQAELDERQKKKFQTEQLQKLGKFLKEERALTQQLKRDKRALEDRVRFLEAALARRQRGQ